MSRGRLGIHDGCFRRCRRRSGRYLRRLLVADARHLGGRRYADVLPGSTRVLLRTGRRRQDVDAVLAACCILLDLGSASLDDAHQRRDNDDAVYCLHVSSIILGLPRQLGGKDSPTIFADPGGVDSWKRVDVSRCHTRNVLHGHHAPTCRFAAPVRIPVAGVRCVAAVIDVSASASHGGTGGTRTHSLQIKSLLHYHCATVPRVTGDPSGNRTHIMALKEPDPYL